MTYVYANQNKDVPNRPVQQAETLKTSGSGLHEDALPGINQPGVLLRNKQRNMQSNGVKQKRQTDKNKISFVEKELDKSPLSQALLDWVTEEYNMSESVVDYPTVTQVIVEVFPNPEAIWNFCVAYAASAMTRRQMPEETIKIASGDIGVYYMAALTLFYSIEEASVGRIPPLQMLSLELRDMLYAAAPTNRMNRAWVVDWSDYDLLSLINSLPFHSYQNPGITLAPLKKSEDPLGRRVIDLTQLNVTFEDLTEVGPAAFEIIQRYLLGTLGNKRLYPYTENGDTTNIAMFAFSRDPNAINPVDGFRQVVLEAPLKQRDIAYYSLNFFGDKNGRRDGWSPRTVQISTIPMMNLIMKGYESVPANLKYQTHMINFQSVLFNFLAECITAVFNSRDDRNIGQVINAGAFEDGYLDTLTAGQVITAVLQFLSRRYAVHSAWAAGTVLPDPESKVIGAGSRYMTFEYVDNYHTFLPLIEQLAGCSAFYDAINDTYYCPVLTHRGDLQTVDYNALGGSDLSYILYLLYPQLNGTGIAYPLKIAGLLPDTIDFSSAGNFSLTSGSSPRNAGDSMNAAISSLQAYCAIGAAVGSRDGSYHKGLYLTHYLANTVDPGGFDITPLQQVVAVLSHSPVTSKAIATFLSVYSPVMYGPANATLIGAYQVLFNRNNSVMVDRVYSVYRASREVADGHKRAANVNAPDEFSLHIAHKTYTGMGGGFFSIFSKGGKIIDTGAEIFGKILGLVAPKVAKKVSGYIDKGSKGMKDMLHNRPELAIHFTPAVHGLVHPEAFFAAADHLEKNGQYFFSKHTGNVMNKRINLKHHDNKGRAPSKLSRGKRRGNRSRNNNH